MRLRIVAGIQLQHIECGVPILLILLAAALVFPVTGESDEARNPDDSGGRPNIVLIVVDDQRWDEYGAAGHPYLQTPNIDRMAREGVNFINAYAASPLCSPNRASILTGQYPSRHGIVDNIARDESSHRLELFPSVLQEAGYETAHVGKWHMGNDASPRPGYDYWVSFAGQGRSQDPVLFENGKSSVVPGYVTDILTERAVAFIERPRQRPFFLYLGHKAIHPDVRQLDNASIDFSYGSKYSAASRHAGRYAHEKFARRDNSHEGEEAVGDKPVLRKALRDKNSQTNRDLWQSVLDIGTSEQTIRDRAEMLLAVDESLGAIIQALVDRDILDRTIIIFTSDNGYFYGEHGLSIERRMPYEEGIRVPLLVWPSTDRWVPHSNDNFALSIDIAPTVLDLANIQSQASIQGRSLLGVMSDPAESWRDSFLVEYTSYEKPMPWLIHTSYRILRKGDFKYIYWIHHPESHELYNLRRDPFELANLAGQHEYQDLLAELREELILAVGRASIQR